MPPAKATQTRHKRSSAWFVSPPPNWPFEDLTVLREVDGETGVELLLALCNVRLFAEAPPQIRGELFSVPLKAPVNEAAPDRLRDALIRFSQMVREPTRVRDGDVATACRVVAEWAEDHSHRVTAVVYAEAAARLLPEDAELANLAGRACRRAGDRARAELWYERGGGLARRAGNVQQYVDSRLGYGNLLRDFGEYARALRWVKSAGVAARKRGLREAAAEALHDAYALAYLREDLFRASSLARRAAKVYPIHARRMPYFAADLALLLARRGLYDLAIELIQIVQEHLTAPVEALQMWGLAAYASGGAGDQGLFAIALHHVEQMGDAYAESSAAAYAYAAAGAHLMQDWDAAERLIEEATRRAAGDTLSEELAARVSRDISMRAEGVPPPPEEDPAVAGLRGLAPEVAARLRRWRGPTWRPRRKP
jgi:tetratricopeptide (TPR) repeat protein